MLLRRRDRLLSWNGGLDTHHDPHRRRLGTGQLHVQAGGGTVADAEPAYEYNESVNKAKAVFRAVELAAGSRTGSRRCACS